MVIFLDGADLETMKAYESRVAGYTTNPSLMRKAGIDNYKSFAAAVLMLTNKPVSFEVFADDLPTMREQGEQIAAWGDNVYVKIPITTTSGLSTGPVIAALSMIGIKVNVTAIMTLDQIRTAARHIYPTTPAILSIFAGRIADTGRDPVPFITTALRVKHSETQVLWASTREVYNVKQAEQAGADIITMTPDLIKKMDLFGKDLAQYSLETVQMFYNDAKGITL